MPRLPLVDPGDPDLPPDVREIVDRFGGADGFAGLPNIMRAVANHPGAARIVAEGQGARLASIAQATGQTQRFLAVLAAYQTAKDVTLRRMYLETMQDIMTHSSALVVDDRLKGLVPFLPLNVPPPKTVAPAAPASSASVGASR